MRCDCRWFLGLLTAVLLSIPNSGRANDAPIDLMGGGATPKSAHSSVRMESEEVTIQLLKDSYVVDAVFHFFNTGETTTEWVGFPKRGMGYSSMFKGTRDFIRFETWVGDQQVQSREEQDWLSKARTFISSTFSDFVEDRRWMVKQVTFPGRAKTTTRVRYEAPYDKRDAWSAFYIFGTGSYWKGNIGKATFTIDGSGLVGAKHVNVRYPRKLAAKRRMVNESVARYEINNFKPDSDDQLTVVFYDIFMKKNVPEEGGVHRDVIDRPKLRWREDGGKDAAQTQTSETEKPSSVP